MTLKPGRILAGALAALIDRHRALVPIVPAIFVAQLAAQGLSLSGNGLLVAAALVVMLITQIMLLVRASRVALLGSDAVGDSWWPGWGERETRCLLCVPLFGLILIVGGMVAALMAPLLSPPVAVAVMLSALAIITARFMFLFPAIAADHAIDMRRAWILSGPHQWVLPLLVTVVPLVLALPSYGLLALGTWTIPVVLLFNIATQCFSVNVLAIAYHEALRMEADTPV